jgi:hypothetical protein
MVAGLETSTRGPPMTSNFGAWRVPRSGDEKLFVRDSDTDRPLGYYDQKTMRYIPFVDVDFSDVQKFDAFGEGVLQTECVIEDGIEIWRVPDVDDFFG